MNEMTASFLRLVFREALKNLTPWVAVIGLSPDAWAESSLLLSAMLVSAVPQIIATIWSFRKWRERKQLESVT